MINLLIFFFFQLLDDIDIVEKNFNNNEYNIVSIIIDQIRKMNGLQGFWSTEDNIEIKEDLDDTLDKNSDIQYCFLTNMTKMSWVKKGLTYYYILNSDNLDLTQTYDAELITKVRDIGYESNIKNVLLICIQRAITQLSTDGLFYENPGKVEFFELDVDFMVEIQLVIKNIINELNYPSQFEQSEEKMDHITKIVYTVAKDISFKVLITYDHHVIEAIQSFSDEIANQDNYYHDALELISLMKNYESFLAIHNSQVNKNRIMAWSALINFYDDDTNTNIIKDGMEPYYSVVSGNRKRDIIEAMKSSVYSHNTNMIKTTVDGFRYNGLLDIRSKFPYSECKFSEMNISTTEYAPNDSYVIVAED